MLATILRTPVAEEVSIGIMDAFVLMRQYISSNDYEKRLSRVETKLIDYDSKINELFNKFNHEASHHIFFQGQIYDAYSKLVDILNEATNNIVIIDNYVDKKFLDIISKVNVPVTLITHPKTCLTKTDLNKYHKQYHNLKVQYCSLFHDRFIILDQKNLYHSGASFKDLGKKCFAINKIEDPLILEQLFQKVLEMM